MVPAPSGWRTGTLSASPTTSSREGARFCDRRRRPRAWISRFFTMVTYIVRRLVTAAFILLGASFLVYLLTALSGDPLEELRTSSAPNRQALMDARINLLDLDTPAPLRYFKWLGGAAQ